MSETLLAARGIRREFRLRRGFLRGSRPLLAVDDVSLEVKRGEVLGIVGGSGSGKSTLAKILLGLDTPTAGTITFKGCPLDTMGRLERADHIQPVFQDPYLSLNPRKTIEAIIAMPLAIRRRPVAEIRERVHRIMSLTGLPPRLAGAYPGQLSGGQRQRVAIARALVSEPELVVCDEPTSALDVSIQAQILNMLQELRRELGLTYVLISHNLAVVEHMASEVMVMREGRVVEHGPTAEVFAAPRSPYTRLLLDSVLTPEPEKGLPKLQFVDA